MPFRPIRKRPTPSGCCGRASCGEPTSAPPGGDRPRLFLGLIRAAAERGLRTALRCDGRRLHRRPPARPSSLFVEEESPGTARRLRPGPAPGRSSSGTPSRMRNLRGIGRPVANCTGPRCFAGRGRAAPGLIRKSRRFVDAFLNYWLDLRKIDRHRRLQLALSRPPPSRRRPDRGGTG